MNKFIFAFVACVALTIGFVAAKPGVAPYSAPYSALPPIPYQAIPLAPSYTAPYAAPHHSLRSYSLPSYAPPILVGPSQAVSSHLQPIAIQKGYGSLVAPAAPSLLVAEPSNPAAASSAASSSAALNPGNYQQLVVPSYELLAGNKLNLIGGHPSIVGGAPY